MSMNKVTTHGTLWTITEFVTPQKDRVQIKVTTEKSCTVSNQLTYYCWYIYFKPYKHKLWTYVGGKQSGRDPLVNDFITQQQFYEALHNHWQTLNPLRMFGTYLNNGEYKEFKVTPIENDTPLKCRVSHNLTKLK